MKIQTRKNLIWFAFWVIAFAFTFGIWILLINYDLFRKLFILPVIVVVFGLILVSLKLKNIKIKSISKALKETKTWKSFGKNLWEKKWKYLLVTIIIVGVGAALYFPLYWDVILPNEGIYLDKPVNELEDDIYGNPSYYPKPQEPTHLYSINTSDCQGEELVTIMSLQGVLAKDKPQIYISDDNYYAKWLNLIKAEGVSVTEEQDPWALVDQFSSDVEGYIIYSAEGGNAPGDSITSFDTVTYEHQDESYLVAVSLCGILNACAIEEGDVNKAIDAGLTEVFDARGMDVDDIFEGEYWDQFRHDMIFEVEHHSSRRYSLIDYPVFCGAPVWHAENQEDRANYLRYFEADSPSFGWGAVSGDEGSLNLQVTHAGGFFMPSDWARDLSVLSAFQVECEQKPVPEVEVEDNVHYTTVVMSDGDNLQWFLGDYGSESFFGNEHVGDFPMGWMVPPAAAELCPLVMRWYYENSPANTRFVAGNSGHGLIYPSKHPWREIHINRSEDILQKADINVSVIQDWGWKPESFEDTTELSTITGCIYNDYRQYALQSGKAMWLDDKPCISFTYNLWLGMDSPSIIRNTINSASKDIHDPNAYSLIVVHAWSYNMDEVYDVVNSLPEDVRVVDPETFIRLYSQNVEHSNSFSLRFRIYEGVWIIFGIIGAVIMVKVYQKYRERKKSASSSEDIKKTK